MLGVFPAASNSAQPNNKNVAYPPGFSFEYGEPKIRKSRTRRRTNIAPEPGRYDVLLCAEGDEIGEALSPAANGTLSVRDAGDDNFRFDASLRYHGQIHEWTFLCVTERFSHRTASRIAPCFETDSGRIGGSVRVVERRSAVRLQIPDPPSERERRTLAEFYTAKSRSFWLHGRTALPLDVVMIVRQFLVPPPIFSFEKHDLWIEFCPPCPWRWRDWRLLARKSNETLETSE